MGSQFEEWLRQELHRVLEVAPDDDVFVPYILSMLDDEEEVEEVGEGIRSILAGISSQEDTIERLTQDIQAQWRICQAEAAERQVKAGPGIEKKVLDLSAHLATIAVAQPAARSSATTVDPSVKAAILAQYAGQVEESSEEEEEEEGGAEAGMMRNTNAEAVSQAELEKREKSRLASQAKKDKDADDREKQKKQAEERKKKAQDKAVKGERRR